MTNFEKFKTLPLSQAAAFSREYITSACWACAYNKDTCGQRFDCFCDDGTAGWPDKDYNPDSFPWCVIETLPSDGPRVCDMPEGTVGRAICKSDGLFVNLGWYSTKYMDAHGLKLSSEIPNFVDVLTFPIIK